MNELIEQTLVDFPIPVAFLYYDGDAPDYVTYQHTDSDNVLGADNAIQNYVDFYDFDVYSKGNYFSYIDQLKEKLTAAGFLWQPSRSSGDMYERDTRYFHKTLCFAIERSN